MLDSQGRLIGVNTAIISRSGASAGVGFAVPVNTVRAAVPFLINGQMVNRGFLGLALAPMQISKQVSDEGVLVLDVTEDGPAAQEGVRPTRLGENGEVEWGDVVISINGQRIADSEILLAHLQEHQAGEEITLGIKRGETYSRLNIRLGQRAVRSDTSQK